MPTEVAECSQATYQKACCITIYNTTEKCHDVSECDITLTVELQDKVVQSPAFNSQTAHEQFIVKILWK